MIKLREFSRKLSGTRYDSDRKKYIGYEVDITSGKQRIRGQRFGTKREAETFIETLRNKNRYRRHGLKSPSGNAATVKLADLFEKRLADVPFKKQRYLVERVHNYLLNIVGVNCKVVELTFEHLKEFNRRRLADKTPRETLVSGHTVRREMTEISSTLKQASDYFPELEEYQMPKIPRLKLSDIRRERKISPKEQQALIDYFNRPKDVHESYEHYLDRLMIGHSFEFALLTGSRRKEAVCLKRTDYNPDLDMLRIVRWKTIRSKKNSVSIFSPVPNRVKALLAKRLELMPDDCEYFFSRNGNEMHGYIKSLKAACAKLGIIYGRYNAGGMTFHDSRHTFVSKLIEAGTDIETTRDLAGLTREMVLRYAHSSPEAKAKAALVIDDDGSDSVKNDLSEVFDSITSGKLSKPEFIALMEKTRQLVRTANA